jgi:3-polyprenyl-4-hydroxybenzoate decarboxylase
MRHPVVYDEDALAASPVARNPQEARVAGTLCGQRVCVTGCKRGPVDLLILLQTSRYVIARRRSLTMNDDGPRLVEDPISVLA